jgi:hypothetical protein
MEKKLLPNDLLYYQSTMLNILGMFMEDHDNSLEHFTMSYHNHEDHKYVQSIELFARGVQIRIECNPSHLVEVRIFFTKHIGNETFENIFNYEDAELAFDLWKKDMLFYVFKPETTQGV